MNGVAVCRKLGAMVVVVLLGSAILVANIGYALFGLAAAGGCAGTAYVTNYHGTVSVINAATRAASTTIPVGKFRPAGVAIDPNRPAPST